MASITPEANRPPIARAPRRGMSRRLRDDLRAYLFISPWIFSLLVFTGYPMLASFYFSMTKYNIVSPPVWIGLENFRVMFTEDSLYWLAVWNTVYYTAISVPLSLAVALGLALLLSQRARGIGIYRTIFYLPSLVPTVASTLLWIVLLNPRLGLINVALETVGLPRLGWLQSEDWSKPAIILMTLWTGTGGAMLIFLAGIKDVPQSLIDAAMIDGANGWQRFRYVTLPLLTPTIYFNLILGIIGSFQVFGQVLVASGGGAGQAGPLNSLLMYMVLLYRNAFRSFNMGYASALALVMFIVLVLLTLLVVRTSNAWVHYEAAPRR
ncbi:MAG: sugar ABC transporter permease [Roseiflexaceae bacterium]|nr:sugar ABC transporter permease [Roseiflexaceae bacterium]